MSDSAPTEQTAYHAPAQNAQLSWRRYLTAVALYPVSSPMSILAR
jgi:hypothetical protein